jgi:hypothetical protein
MQSSKPPPLFAGRPVRRVCPVCGAIAYSIAGMHPQCAMQQSDPVLARRLRALHKTALKNRKPR